MSFFQWDARFDIGVNEMNGEHKEIMNLMNRLYELNEKRAPKTDLATAISNLATYTLKHFSDEEAFMASIKYPDLEKHKTIHQNLLTNLKLHQEKFEKGSGVVEADFFAFLKLWLSAHIQGIDMKYGDYVKQRKVG